MELDELQQAWGQYDKKLSESLKINEQLLKSMNLDKSKKEMNTPFAYELGSLIIVGVSMIFIIATTYKYAHIIELLASGILTSILLGLALIGAYKKVKLLSSIDYYRKPIVDLQKSLIQFDKLYLKCKKLELILFPVFVIVAIPILTMGLRGFNLLEHLGRYSIAFVSSLVLFYPVVLWIYKHWYSKKLSNVNDFIEELNRFELEQ
jgi:Na+/H+-dicarboxylate symporter